MNKTLYISDLDGTLLNGESKISEKTKTIINNLAAKNIMFTYATARSYSSASRIVKELNLTIPVITYNGTFFVNQMNGTIINSITFAPKVIWFIIEIVKRQKENTPLVYSIIDGEERVSYLVGKESQGIQDYLDTRKGDKRLRRVTTEEELYHGDIFYFTFIGEQESLSRLREELMGNQEESSPLFRYTYQEELYRPWEHWLELMPLEATKAAGALRLKELTECNRIVCFGDALNDISLFEIADEAYAVGNAVPELKKLATGIIGSNVEDGVAKWLLEHLKS